MVAAQTEKWGDLEEKSTSESEWLFNEEGNLVLLTRIGPIITIPETLTKRALQQSS